MTSLLPALTGSFSTPAAGNPTGAMVEAAYVHHGIDARYLNCDVAPDDLPAAVAGARAMGWIGFNCSLPHKVAVIEEIDGLARSAELIGAVNCVVRTDQGWLGENTDGQGFLSSLRTVADPAAQRVLILGAGGAARAIAVELALAGADRIWIANRSVGKAEEIATLVDSADGGTTAYALAWDGVLTPPDDATIVVNGTSLGLPGSGPVPVSFEGVAPGLVVCDVIPNPPDTDLLQRARAAGATTLDGRGMLLDQAAINIRLWTGVDPDRTVMGRALDIAIAGWEHP
ncbi:shikimate dehydrogenase family protein [Microlunatus ginsengisoli]|uniref:Shikimate dehydrogenase (NADP(+)) n=1 Tax=Microlunatus ginsengisoli TaxID=363863 RepID=A0ABP7AM18_9ACTN